MAEFQIELGEASRLITVDAEMLDKLIDRARKEIDRDDAFKEKVSEALPRRNRTARLDAVMAKAKELVSYLVRKNLSGKKFNSASALSSALLDLVMEAEENVIAGLKGIIKTDDPVSKKLIQEILAQHFSLMQQSFAQRFSLDRISKRVASYGLDVKQTREKAILNWLQGQDPEQALESAVVENLEFEMQKRELEIDRTRLFELMSQGKLTRYEARIAWDLLVGATRGCDRFRLQRLALDLFSLNKRERAMIEIRKKEVNDE